MQNVGACIALVPMADMAWQSYPCDLNSRSDLIFVYNLQYHLENRPSTIKTRSNYTASIMGGFYHVGCHMINHHLLLPFRDKRVCESTSALYGGDGEGRHGPYTQKME